MSRTVYRLVRTGCKWPREVGDKEAQANKLRSLCAVNHKKQIELRVKSWFRVMI